MIKIIRLILRGRMNNPQSRIPIMASTITDLIISYDLFTHRFERLIKPLGLNMTQMSLLTHFSRKPEVPSTVSKLVTVMGLNQPGITKAVKAMCDKQWLRKQVDDNDARIQWLFITEEGLNALISVQKVSLPTLTDSFSCLDKDELNNFSTLISTFKQHLDTTRPK